MQINNFAVQLEKSNGATAAEFWTSAYKKFFPEFSERFAMPKYTLAQRRGVDVLVYLGNDQIKRVDEKLREDSYPDIILEHTSHDRMKTKGWIEKEMWIDYQSLSVSLGFIAAGVEDEPHALDGRIQRRSRAQ
jgi:hypothetical protein